MGNIQKFITSHMKNRRSRLIRRQRLMAAILAAIIKRISLTKKLFILYKKIFFQWNNQPSRLQSCRRYLKNKRWGKLFRIIMTNELNKSSMYQERHLIWFYHIKDIDNSRTTYFSWIQTCSLFTQIVNEACKIMVEKLWVDFIEKLFPIIEDFREKNGVHGS